MGNAVVAKKRLTKQGKEVSAQAKAVVLADAKLLIPTGATIAQIAAKHGIAERTLEYWLASLGDEYVELRQLWIDNLLQEAGDLLKDSINGRDAGLRLARARELWKRATWYAERRDRARYGEQQPGQGGQLVQINIGIRRGEPLDVVAEPVDSLPVHE